MTSSGLKRPSDFETTPQHSSGPVLNGSDNKRRCTNFNDFHSSSPFKDSSTILMPLNEEINSIIQEEIHKAHVNNNYPTNGNREPPVLTISQTHMICEKLIRDREQKLREEYDRILACKLALTTTNLAFNLQQQAAAVAMQAQHQQQRAAVAAVAMQQVQQQTGASAANINSIVPSGPVLLVSNLDEQLAIPESLFTLFGVFGDVIRVKILFNKKDNALIQMADANQAQVAQGYLDKQKIFGKIIRVTRSKHQLVQMPRDGNQSDAGLTKDFTNSPLHRFKIPGSRNYLNIYPPSNTLHISNIPQTIDEDTIQKAFKEACNFEFSSFKFFPKDRKMALMKFNSIEHATIALIKMHNFLISEGTNLKVSFSKSVMQH